MTWHEAMNGMNGQMTHSVVIWELMGSWKLKPLQMVKQFKLVWWHLWMIVDAFDIGNDIFVKISHKTNVYKNKCAYILGRLDKSLTSRLQVKIKIKINIKLKLWQIGSKLRWKITINNLPRFLVYWECVGAVDELWNSDALWGRIHWKQRTFFCGEEGCF